MGLPWLSWPELYRRWIDARAARINDPVERLRYLRKANEPFRLLVWMRFRWVLVLPALVLAVIFLPTTRSSPVHAGRLTGRSAEPPVRQTVVVQPQSVWLVEAKESYEVFSNGLRIETTGTVTNEARQDASIRDGQSMVVSGRIKPAGIVFHTTESHIAPFEQSHNLRLQRVGQWLRDFVASNRSYHYMIDRFGRVHRIVRESDVAFHAGASVWGNSREVFVGLNHSFLAVAFESQTAAGGEVSDSVTPAQIHAAATLTAMLRSRYNIEPGNCVTHAQVSVNPANMRIGLHTDWGANFPFGDMGLPDNYAAPFVSIYRFGFIADDSYLAATGPRLARGIRASEDVLAKEALNRKASVAMHRSALQQHYRTTVGALPGQLAAASAERKENHP